MLGKCQLHNVRGDVVGTLEYPNLASGCRIDKPALRIWQVISSPLEIETILLALKFIGMGVLGLILLWKDFTTT